MKKNKYKNKKKYNKNKKLLTIIILSIISVAINYIEDNTNLKLPYLTKFKDFFRDLKPLKAGSIYKVVDGDTVVYVDNDRNQIRVRLYGIDAPETSQQYGRESKKALEKLLKNSTVTVETINKDQYGREVAVIYGPDGVNINELMVAQGEAWVYSQYCTKKFCKEWKNQQEKAKKERRGLWKNRKPVPPWEYRKSIK